MYLMFGGETPAISEDRIAHILRSSAQNVLVVIFGLLPILFFPSVTAPAEYTKVIIVITGIVAALILASLSMLRSGTVSIGVSYTLVALWVVAGLSFVSSILSGDFKDSMIGDLFSIHSTIFLILLAVIPTAWMILRPSKASIMRMYVLLAVSTLVLVLFHLVRIIFGVDTLSFSVFTSTVGSPVGGWNDLALFLGLTVILSLVALEQLSLTKIGKILFGIVVAGALIMLGIINFFMVWIVLGITSLVTIVYSLRRGRFSGAQLSLTGRKPHNTISFAVAFIVFLVSIVFVIGGSSMGSAISKYTNVSYVEVRPSFEATANIARSVYEENAFLGIGANKFADAWRMHRDLSINQTLFWNTDFNAGSGFITTAFVTLGVLGGTAWLVFILMFFITGVRRLLVATSGDRMWYFIAISSFVTASYVWIMSIVYVPGVVILFLGALCTGIALSAMDVLSGTKGRLVVAGSDERTGFALTLVVIGVIIGSVSALYGVSRHYMSVYAFNESIQFAQQGKPIQEVEKQIEKAFQLSSSDLYLRRIAEYQMGRMNAILALPQPTQEQIQEFQNAREIGIQTAQQAISLDQGEPGNWSILGSIFGVLASMNIEGAKDRSVEALMKARELNPKNPLPDVELAIVEARSGNIDAARTYIQEAIALKPNFTEAFFLLSQLEIGAGNVEAAIQSTLAVITLEPQNPARYYQLGVLETARKNLKGAIPAFEQAVALDRNYANARYLLALAYDEVGMSAEARAQLQIVQELNPGNPDVATLISVIDTEGSLASLRANASRTISEAVPSVDANGVVSTTEPVDSSLVTPVNTGTQNVTDTVTGESEVE